MYLTPLKHHTFNFVSLIMKHWIQAFRLRTLPLGIASISMGNMFAYSEGSFSWMIFILSLSTAILLQILSNLANDYGDSINGADNELRKGPARQTQLSNISRGQMKMALYVCALFTLISGITLLLVSGLPRTTVLIFLGLGLLAIIAAIKYTSGENPYGYAGLGDVSVLMFFGWLGILGSFYLQTTNMDWRYILPATASGLFMVAVLNVNNIRDIPSDKVAGKLSIPVRLGRRNAVIYHWLLLGLGFLFAIVFVLLNFRHYSQFLFLIIIPFLIVNARSVKTKEDPMQLDPYLKQMVMTTMLFVISFGAGHIISHI